MNIFRPQKPYRFYPATYRPAMAPLLQWVGRRWRRRKMNVPVVHIEGVEHLKKVAAAGGSMLIAPNHADHADPTSLSHAGYVNGFAFHFMAAREVFEQSPWTAPLFQSMGVFSVDREGNDLTALKTAMGLVQEGKYPLVIFPEGEIYHHHETLDELNEGVATIVIKAASKIGDARPCVVVPTALRYVYDESCSETFSRRLDRLETRIAWKPRPELPVVDRIYRLGGGLLALKEEEFLGHAQVGSLWDRISDLRLALVTRVENKHGLNAGTGTIPQRIRAARGRIRKQLTKGGEGEDAGEVVVDPEVARQLYDDLDTLYVASQLYSYPGQYIREQPTVSRIAETLLKLEEDVLGQGSYECRRECHITFGTPIDVNTFIHEQALTTKTAVGPLTRRIASDIQTMLGKS